MHCQAAAAQSPGDRVRQVPPAPHGSASALASQGKGPDKRWKIDGRMVRLDELRDALKGYWDTISNSYPDVDAVEVVLIDLSLRGQRTSEVG